MDMKETSAMTEAAGLTNEQNSAPRPSGEHARSLDTHSQDAAIRWAEWLREATQRSAAVALCGVRARNVVARRR